MTAGDHFTATIEALGGIVPQSLHWDANGMTVHFATCQQFEQVCERLNVPAKHRTTRNLGGLHTAGHVEHCAELSIALLFHLHWPWSTCETNQPHPSKEHQ